MLCIFKPQIYHIAAVYAWRENINHTDIIYNSPIGIVEDLQGQICNLQYTLRHFLLFEIVSRFVIQIKKLWMQVAETFNSYFRDQVTWTQCWSFSAGGRPLTIMWLSLTQFICERKCDRSVNVTHCTIGQGQWRGGPRNFGTLSLILFTSKYFRWKFHPCPSF